MYLLQLLDVWAYHLVVTVWGLFWPVAALICTLALVERWFALERKQPFRPWLFNLVCYAWFLSMMLVLFWSGWNSFVGHLSGSLQWLPPRLAAPESGLGVAMRLAIALLVYDFLIYWYHRLSHALPALWVLHRLHHDEQHVNAATSLRSHWLNIPLTQLMVMVPLTWLLGFNALPGQMSLVLTAFAAFTHLNVDFGLGRLTRLIVGPRYHRVHHDRERRFHDSNYADMFPVWDLWFGTFRDPELHGRRPLGLEGHAPTTTYAGVMLPPFWNGGACGASGRPQPEAGWPKRCFHATLYQGLCPACHNSVVIQGLNRRGKSWQLRAWRCGFVPTLSSGSRWCCCCLPGAVRCAPRSALPSAVPMA